MVADKVGRAYGLLRHSHLIESKEALNLLSLLRLGGSLEYFPADTVSLCDELVMEIQPAHLQLHTGRKLAPEERDAIRAKIVRDRLQSLHSPDIHSKTHTQEPDSEDQDNTSDT